jgi:hypothetical protein
MFRFHDAVRSIEIITEKPILSTLLYLALIPFERFLHLNCPSLAEGSHTYVDDFEFHRHILTICRLIKTKETYFSL